MTSISFYRPLSWLCVVGLVVFYAWIAVAFGLPGTPIVALITLGLVLATLKWGVREPVDYWRAVAQPSQMPRVALLILVVLVAQLAIGTAVRLIDETTYWRWSYAIYLLVWTGVSLAFIGLGVVQWPERRASPQVRELLIVAVPAILVAAAIGYLGAVEYSGPRVTPSFVELAIGGGSVLLGATMEEVLFRVLLLTALVHASGSRTQALILSSVIFALAHTPAALAGPVVNQDWVQLSVYAKSFLPELTVLTAFGFLVGALWLRTGSIALIAVVHAITNLGPVLVGGLSVL